MAFPRVAQREIFEAKFAGGGTHRLYGRRDALPLDAWNVLAWQFGIA